MSQPHLICYLGRNSSGKSYRANQLIETQNYVKVSMADALRELAWKILGRVPEDYNKFKDNDIDSYYGLTGRDFLQNLGQGVKDLFGEDIWVKQWEVKVSSLITKQTTKQLIDKIKETGAVSKEYIKHLDEVKNIIVERFKNEDMEEIGLDEIFLYQSSSISLFTPVKPSGIWDLLQIHPNNPLLEDTEAKITTDDIRFPIEVESAHKLGATFIWCDYQKGNYPVEEHSSEALANRILASGKYQDGDEIPFEELKTFF